MRATHRLAQDLRAKNLRVYGHRGARSYGPMNTLPAFELAILQGAGGIELDVQLSSDGQLIVLHDFTVDGTTNGSGAVRNLSFAQLRELDASARFVPTAVPLDGKIPGPFRNLRLPTLDEVFELVRDAADKNFVVNVEIKAPYCAADGKEGPEALEGLEAAVAASVDRYAMADQVIISSFNPPTLGRFKTLRPEIPVGFLVEKSAPVNTPLLMLNRDYEAWHPHFSMVNEQSVARETQAGRMVTVWTVNEVSEALRLAGLGVHGIITDTPDRMVHALGLTH